MTDTTDEHDEFYEGSLSWEPPAPDPPTGYAKPPTKHQFKPGQSGNPSGRPRKRSQRKIPSNFTAAMAAELAIPQTVKKNGKAIIMSKVEVAASMLSQDMVHSDPKVRHRAVYLLDKMDAFQNAAAYAEHLRQLAELEASRGGWTPEMERRFQAIEADYFENVEPERESGDRRSAEERQAAERRRLA